MSRPCLILILIPALSHIQTPRLASAIQDSPAGRDCLPDGRLLLIIYDAKLDSELGPYGDACKTTAMRMDNFKRVVAALRLARLGGGASSQILPEGDVLVVLDGFHDLHTSHIIGLLSASERCGGNVSEGEDPGAPSRGAAKRKMAAAPPKTVKHLKLVHSEDVLAARRMRSARGFMGLKQVERLLCISASSLAAMRARPNILHPGSTSGQALGHELAPE